MPHLITRERAVRNIGDPTSVTAKQGILLDGLISAASAAIERYCRRRFNACQYDELHHGSQSSALLLKNYPVLSVERVAFNPTVVLEIENTSTSNQRAMVQVTADSVKLTHTASGTSTVNEFAFSTYTTLSSLVTAIDAVGSGWDASTPISDFSLWPSSDLKAIQGAFNAMNAKAGLRIHTEELSEYEVDMGRGLLTRGMTGLWGLVGDQIRWEGGLNYWRIIYNAGFGEVPEDVQEACAQFVSAMYFLAQRDPGLAQEQIPTVISRAQNEPMNATTKLLLNQYRRLRV